MIRLICHQSRMSVLDPADCCCNPFQAYGCAAAALRSDPNCRAAHLMNAYLKLVQGCDAEALQFIRRQSACLMAASGKAETGS